MIRRSTLSLLSSTLFMLGVILLILRYQSLAYLSLALGVLLAIASAFARRR